MRCDVGAFEIGIEDADSLMRAGLEKKSRHTINTLRRLTLCVMVRVQPSYPSRCLRLHGTLEISRRCGVYRLIT
jgi:hypothetical protein